MNFSISFSFFAGWGLHEICQIMNVLIKFLTQALYQHQLSKWYLHRACFLNNLSKLSSSVLAFYVTVFPRTLKFVLSSKKIYAPDSWKRLGYHQQGFLSPWGWGGVMGWCWCSLRSGSGSSQECFLLTFCAHSHPIAILGTDYANTYSPGPLKDLVFYFLFFY